MSSRSLLILAALGAASPVAIHAAPPAATTPAAAPHYAVTLLSHFEPIPDSAMPTGVAGEHLYRSQASVFGKNVYFVRVGFFATAAEAEAARSKLLARFPGAFVAEVPAEEYARITGVRTRPVLAARPPAPVAPKPPVPAVPKPPIAAVAAVAPKPAPVPAPAKPAPAAPAAAAAPATNGAEQPAATLMEQARAALTSGQNVQAISLLNQILRLPPNRQSQDAQELIGLAHERNREITAARREYNLYLKLYPEGEGATRVRQRLAALSAPDAKLPTLRTPKKKTTDVTTTYGSVSQHYYHGNTQVDTTLTGPTPVTSTLTATDQSSLITSLDLTGRQRSGDWDNRVVLRDTYTINFLQGQENQNRLYAAYGEIRNKEDDYGLRLGRQPGNTGGVLGRFDGLLMHYGLTPKWRVNVVAGIPVEFNPINSDKKFWGINTDFGTFAEHWNGNAYYMQQTVDGLIDREAVGLELRYFETKQSYMMLTDYDLAYGKLNILMLQGTWQGSGDRTYNFLIDHRLAPVLQTSNSVIGEINTSVMAQLALLGSESLLRQQALDRTPTSDLLMFGVMQKLSTVWQVGGDIKVYEISGTPASGSLPASPGSGVVWVYTGQGIATGLFSKRDITVLSLSYIDSDSYQGQSAGINNRSLWRDRWTFDTSLRYYLQQDSAGTDLARLTPMARVSYRWGERTTLEFEGGIEKTRTESSTTVEDTTRTFFMLGYRYDFF